MAGQPADRRGAGGVGMSQTWNDPAALAGADRAGDIEAAKLDTPDNIASHRVAQSAAVDWVRRRYGLTVAMASLIVGLAGLGVRS